MDSGTNIRAKPRKRLKSALKSVVQDDDAHTRVETQKIPSRAHLERALKPAPGAFNICEPMERARLRALFADYNRLIERIREKRPLTVEQWEIVEALTNELVDISRDMDDHFLVADPVYYRWLSRLPTKELQRAVSARVRKYIRLYLFDFGELSCYTDCIVKMREVYFEVACWYPDINDQPLVISALRKGQIEANDEPLEL